MPRALKPCPCRGCAEHIGLPCSELVKSGRCDGCTRAAERARGTATQRGYGTAHRRSFREQVLAGQPVCVLCRTAWATVADHWPRSRRELAAAGENPNDPKFGRGLCKPCHDRSTSELQPGGWHAN